MGSPVPSNLSSSHIIDHYGYSFKAALETTRINKESFLKYSSLSSENLKDLFSMSMQDLSYFVLEEKWHKPCQGHEYKLAGRTNRRWKALKIAREGEDQYKQNPKIIQSSVWSELRGANDPFVHFKYIDNCRDCRCRADKVKKTQIVNVSSVLSDVIKLADDSESSYNTLIKYILEEN